MADQQQPARFTTTTEHEALRKRVHDVSDSMTAAINLHHTDIRVLQRDVADAGKRLERAELKLTTIEQCKNTEHREIRESIHKSAADARKYAASLVSEFRDEMLELRREERDDRIRQHGEDKAERRNETNTAIARATVLTGTVLGVIQVAVAVWR